MIKKLAIIGLITLSLVGCTNKTIDQNEMSNPGQGKNTTTEPQDVNDLLIDIE